MLSAEVGAAESLRACAGPVAADNAGLDFDSNVCISPFSMRGGSNGVVTPGGPGQTADRMAQALRYCQAARLTAIALHCAAASWYTSVVSAHLCPQQLDVYSLQWDLCMTACCGGLLTSLQMCCWM